MLEIGTVFAATVMDANDSPFHERRPKMFTSWRIALFSLALGAVGCTEMETGSKDLDTLTTTQEQQADNGETTPNDQDAQQQTSTDSTSNAAYQDAKQELDEASAAVEKLAAQQKDRFVQNINDQLNQLDTSIAELKEQAKNAQQDARQEIEAQLEDIETKRQALLDRLGELDQAGGNAWEDFKQGVINAWDELQQARDEAKSRVEVQVGDGVDVEVGDGLEVDVDTDATKQNSPSDDAPSGE